MQTLTRRQIDIISALANKEISRLWEVLQRNQELEQLVKDLEKMNLNR